MISEELLSAVLNKTYSKVNDTDGNKVKYSYLSGGHIHDCINIHELAHGCKEFVGTKGFSIVSGFRIDEQNWYSIIENKEIDFYSYRVENTEHEAIFKACEWALKDSK